MSGSIKIDDDILDNKKVLGKILIDEKYPFGLLKFKDESFNFDKKFTCGKALIKVLKPDWL